MTDLRSAAQQALEAHANRYQVVRDGYWWRVKIGDGTQTVGQHHTETGALRLASELHRAFHDGGFVVQEALKAALAEEALQRLTDANQEIEAALEQEPVTKSTWQKLYEAAIDQRNEAVALNQELLEALKEAEPMLDAMLKARDA